MKIVRLRKSVLCRKHSLTVVTYCKETIKRHCCLDAHDKMPGKKSAKSAKGKRSKSGKKSGKKSAKKSRSGTAVSSTSEERVPDMLDPPAMANLYYIAHAATDALDLRGFGWQGGPAKKGKKGKKKK